MMRWNIDMPRFVELVNANLKGQVNTIFEVGALDGKDSVFFSTSYPMAKVYAIEGLPDNFEKHLKSLKGITTINRVICDYDGEIDFFKKEINGLHSIYNRGSIYGMGTIKVPCNRLDTLCKEYGVTSIDIIKIDVEGATYEVLNGLGNLWETIKIMHIETEGFPFFEGQKLHTCVSELLKSRIYND